MQVQQKVVHVAEKVIYLSCQLVDGFSLSLGRAEDDEDSERKRRHACN